MHPDESEYALLVKTLDAHGFRRAMTADEKMRAVLLWSGSSTLPSVSSTAPPPAREREGVQTPDYSRACVVLWCGFGESRTASA